MDHKMKPKPKTMIEYTLFDGQRGQPTVLSSQKQPCKTSKYSNLINVRRVDQDEDSSINWGQVQRWREKKVESVLIALHDYQDGDERIIEVMEMELKNLAENDVYEWVEDCEQKAVTCKWVITGKEKTGGTSSVKGRLAACGFEESLTKRTESPACSKQSLRMLFSVASTVNWDTEAIDKKAAFL